MECLDRTAQDGEMGTDLPVVIQNQDFELRKQLTRV
jgi:hypothetical protein